MQNDRQLRCFFWQPTAQSGFTLVELMIAMVVAIIMGGAMVANYVSQQRSSTIVREVAQLQQQLRGAMYILEHDIRVAGYNPRMVDSTFGVTDIQRRNLADGQPDNAGIPSLTVAMDWQPDPANPNTNDNGVLDAGEMATYFLQTNANGTNDLFRILGAGMAPELVAENIEHMAFAFAYVDADNDIVRDGDDIVWAFSSDGTALDRRLNDDMTDQALGETVTLDRIRMVRMWLLARARNQAQGFLNNEAYAIPELADPVFNDGFRRRLMVRTIQMRNPPG